MRVAAFGGAGRGLAIERRPDPVPGPGQVVLAVARCGICATDLHLTSGRGAIQLPPGAVPGHEYAGEVVAIGPGVEQLRVGDRVTALPLAGCGACAACLAGEPFWCVEGLPAEAGGGFAEQVLVHARQTVPLPDALSWEDGALVEPLAVGLHGVHMARLAPGARVLVLGAGPIGLAATFWARRLGAGPLAVMARSRRREQLAAALGASCFLVAEDDVAAALGGPPEVVIEAAGLPGTLARAVDLVAPRGTVVGLGFCTLPDTLVPAHAVAKQVRLQFAMAYGVADFRHVIATLAAGDVAPRRLVTETVSLATLPALFETLRGPSPHCKVLVDPAASAG
ncbi:MAG TPA: alcohol dehydrogenase catalytic domain-containing protein [Gemmatimonadaceae bacterium]|nr:alcohol dehydrogenase catalytic domain-containing protein [Gemmatimonadaceae bacterium]